MSHFRILSYYKEEFPDPLGEHITRQIKSHFNLEVGEVRTMRALGLIGDFSTQDATSIAKNLFSDPVVEKYCFEEEADFTGASHVVHVSFLPGVTDNVARSAAEAIEWLLKRPLGDGEGVFSSKLYIFSAPDLDEEKRELICKEVLHNDVIEKVEVLTREDIANGKPFSPYTLPPEVETPEVKVIPIISLSDDELIKLSESMGLALSLEEMQVIQSHYQNEENQKNRLKLGLDIEPHDIEIEAFAQTWSEHCKHKIFAAEVDYREGDRKEHIGSIFKEMIKDPTEEIMAKRSDIASVFSDNAGVFHFNDQWDICIKAETHNSPSALEPYGGAMTGIVGVNRDVLGTGRGFLPIFNTDVFCFGPPNYDKPLPGRLHHPRRIFRGVHQGVRDGGNESGIPTVNGSISFDDRFIGKPLVFCGTGGIAPRDLHGRPIHEKWIQPGDRVVMIGGRIGKDGIHGATFSSMGLDETAPSSAVQIGDPITQKRMTDFLIKARDLGLYDFITDNGAGGLSSSIGEMAQECGGAKLDLAKAPLKYRGLAPWEIFLSEAQERMSLSVPVKDIDDFLKLAEKMKVLAVDLGEFTDSGYLELYYEEKIVGNIEMDFLHDGLPKMKLKAEWVAPSLKEPGEDELPELSEELVCRVLSRFNICSKEDWVRQYDHEVQGRSVIKPFVGVNRDAPSDAAVLRPDPASQKGLAVSHGLLPRYSDIDTYDMTCNVVDEALRSLVSVGANPETAIGLDNFCWPDPLEGKDNPDAHFKMAQLVRSGKALKDICTSYQLPCISGKDSMKNDFISKEVKISIPPTLLFTATAVLEDVAQAVSMDFKNEGDAIYVIGSTFDECGASEYYAELGILGSRVPKVDATSAMQRYKKVHALILDKVLASAHDVSEGGLIVAMVESCFGGRLGVDVKTPGQKIDEMREANYWFSESASRILVSVSSENEKKLNETFSSDELEFLGRVTGKSNLIIGDMNLDAEKLYQAWRSPLQGDL